jgi:hypothetical protein
MVFVCLCVCMSVSICLCVLCTLLSIYVTVCVCVSLGLSLSLSLSCSVGLSCSLPPYCYIMNDLTCDLLLRIHVCVCVCVCIYVCVVLVYDRFVLSQHRVDITLVPPKDKTSIVREYIRKNLPLAKCFIGVSLEEIGEVCIASDVLFFFFHLYFSQTLSLELSFSNSLELTHTHTHTSPIAISTSTLRTLSLHAQVLSFNHALTHTHSHTLTHTLFSLSACPIRVPNLSLFLVSPFVCFSLLVSFALVTHPFFFFSLSGLLSLSFDFSLFLSYVCVVTLLFVLICFFLV